MLLELQEIRKTYSRGKESVQAVDGVSLSLDAGQFIAVEGPSGCGKTTLLLVAGGLLEPDSGQVLVMGEDPYALSPDQRAVARANQVGFVFQQFHLIPYLSVLGNVLAPAIASSSNSNQDAEKRAYELIERFGLEQRIHHVPGQLSTGERQRTALARALLNQPKILLADEPTGNLDRENSDVVLGHFKEFVQEGGAVLLVTHDPHAVEQAQSVVKIREGKLVEEEVSPSP